MMKRIFGIILLAAFAIASAGSSKPNIAVLDFTGDKSVSAEQLAFISARFSDQLVQSDRFVILDRSRIADVLHEQGLQQSGVCDSSDCRVRMGQLLGVDKIVTGSLVRFGGEYAIRIEYLDVATGQILATVGLEEQGELDKIYKKICLDGAQALVAKLFPNSKEATTPSSAQPTTQQSTQQPTQPISTQPVLEQPAQVAASKPVAEVPVEAIPKAPTKMVWQRKVAIGLWGVALAGAGGSFYFDQNGSSDKSAYLALQDTTKLQSAYDKINTDKTLRTTAASISISAAVLGLVFWIWGGK